MPQELKLFGKKTLVTGSDTGIGREIGLEFARQGADVVFHYVQNEADAEPAVEEVKSLGRRSAAFQADFDTSSLGAFSATYFLTLSDDTALTGAVGESFRNGSIRIVLPPVSTDQQA